MSSGYFDTVITFKGDDQGINIMVDELKAIHRKNPFSFSFKKMTIVKNKKEVELSDINDAELKKILNKKKELIVKADGPYGSFLSLSEIEPLFEQIAGSFPQGQFSVDVDGWDTYTFHKMKCEFKDGKISFEESIDSDDVASDEYVDFFKGKITKETFMQFFQIKDEDFDYEDFIKCFEDEEPPVEEAIVDTLDSFDIDYNSPDMEEISKLFEDIPDYGTWKEESHKPTVHRSEKEVTAIPSDKNGNKEDKVGSGEKRRKNKEDVEKLLMENAIENEFNVKVEFAPIIDDLKIGDFCIVFWPEEIDCPEEDIKYKCDWSMFTKHRDELKIKDFQDMNKLVPLLEKREITNMFLIKNISFDVDDSSDVKDVLITIAINTDKGNVQYF